MGNSIGNNSHGKKVSLKTGNRQAYPVNGYGTSRNNIRPESGGKGNGNFTAGTQVTHTLNSGGNVHMTKHKVTSHAIHGSKGAFQIHKCPLPKEAKCCFCKRLLNSVYFKTIRRAAYNRLAYTIDAHTFIHPKAQKSLRHAVAHL